MLTISYLKQISYGKPKYLIGELIQKKKIHFLLNHYECHDEIDKAQDSLFFFEN